MRCSIHLSSVGTLTPMTFAALICDFRKMYFALRHVLFGDLFRGRDDVFAVRWENLAKGRSGYSPRCVPVLRRMYAKRLRAYADMGYETNDSSPSNSIPHPSDRLAVSGGL